MKFIADVGIYKTLQDPHAHANISHKMERLCAQEDILLTGNRRKGMPVFTRRDADKNISDEKVGIKIKSPKEADNNGNTTNGNRNIEQLSLLTENTNGIGVYGRPIKIIYLMKSFKLYHIQHHIQPIRNPRLFSTQNNNHHYGVINNMVINSHNTPK
eukprot:541972_1